MSNQTPQQIFNKFVTEFQDYLGIKDAQNIAAATGLSIEDALLYAEESLDQATAGGEFV
jgi:hypothetical protein